VANRERISSQCPTRLNVVSIAAASKNTSPPKATVAATEKP